MLFCKNANGRKGGKFRNLENVKFLLVGVNKRLNKIILDHSIWNTICRIQNGCVKPNKAFSAFTRYFLFLIRHKLLCCQNLKNKKIFFEKCLTNLRQNRRVANFNNQARVAQG